MQNFIDLVIQNLFFGSNGALHGYVQYGNIANNQFFLGAYTTDKQALLDAADNVQYLTDNQQSNTQSGLNRMATDQFIVPMGDRPRAPNYAIVLYDGESNIFRENTVPEAMLAQSFGDNIIAIGVGTNAEPFEIQTISSPLQRTDITLNFLSSFDALSTVVPFVVNKICQGR